MQPKRPKLGNERPQRKEEASKQTKSPTQLERREAARNPSDMLQIRLSKIGSSDSGAAASGAAAGAGGGVGGGGVGGAGAGAGGGPPKSASAAAGGAPESVTVACPDHLVIADLAVAKSLGAVTTSAVAAARTIGRRSRRPLGERVHICCRCEFPIALYGRLVCTYSKTLAPPHFSSFSMCLPFASCAVV